jgi:hypothetical protein
MMLTLDETTLYFHSRRTSATADHKLAGVVKNWAKLIQPLTNSSKNSRASSIRSASTTLRNSASTIATSNHITVGAAEGDSDEELEQRDDNIGGFADELELDNLEADAARSSPIKGGKRVTNNVSFPLRFTYIQ